MLQFAMNHHIFQKRAAQTVISDVAGVGVQENKLAANIALGRNAAGIHWLSDTVAGLFLGEEVAISVLSDLVMTYHEQFDGFTFTRFDGSSVKIRS